MNKQEECSKSSIKLSVIIRLVMKSIIVYGDGKVLFLSKTPDDYGILYYNNSSFSVFTEFIRFHEDIHQWKTTLEIGHIKICQWLYLLQI